MIVVDDPRSPALAPSGHSPPEFPKSSRSDHEVACRRIIRDIIHQRVVLLLAHQFSNERQKFGNLDDRDRDRFRHEVDTNPLDQFEQEAVDCTPSPAGKWLAAETDHAGRVRIQNDLSVAGHPEIFVVGDTASLDRDGKPLPGVAQVAIQQGRYAGKLIHRRLTGKSAPGPFSYFDKGNLAVVGKGFAVLESGKVHSSGLIAWFAWAAVHLQFLADSSLRLGVFLQWVWTYLSGRRGARLIVNPRVSEAQKAVPDTTVKAAASSG